VESLDGHPILRLTGDKGKYRVFDLVSGQATGSLSDKAAFGVAAAYSSATVYPWAITRLDHDQWTVQGARGADRPLIKVGLRDKAETEVYVSSVSGKAVQRTTARERFWNWVGTVPHWLYFTALRQNGRVWSQVVVWSSTVGSFLTLVGLYIGIRQFRVRPGGQWIPYGGFHYWHHALGLVFGVLVLTWVVSGLISMNPWGFLEGGDFDERQRLQGTLLSPSQVAASVQALAQSLPPGAVSVKSCPLHGDLYVVAARADGTRYRLDVNAKSAALTAGDRDFIARTLDSTASANSLLLIDHEDSYYFSHHREHAVLPTYRLIANDQDKTRYYLDPVSGEIRAKIDGDNQMYRWLHQGLHRLDFTPTFRSRPLWDVLMLSLLMGATLVCALGTYLGIQRLTR